VLLFSSFDDILPYLFRLVNSWNKFPRFENDIILFQLPQDRESKIRRQNAQKNEQIERFVSKSEKAKYL
jgi:hypothetical protein